MEPPWQPIMLWINTLYQFGWRTIVLSEQVSDSVTFYIILCDFVPIIQLFVPKPDTQLIHCLFLNGRHVLLCAVPSLPFTPHIHCPTCCTMFLQPCGDVAQTHKWNK